MKQPARMKNGTAKQGKGVQPGEHLLGEDRQGHPAFIEDRPPVLASPMEIPMGTETAMSPQKEQKSRKNTMPDSPLLQSSAQMESLR